MFTRRTIGKDVIVGRGSSDDHLAYIHLVLLLHVTTPPNVRWERAPIAESWEGVVHAKRSVCNVIEDVTASKYYEPGDRGLP